MIIACRRFQLTSCSNFRPNFRMSGVRPTPNSSSTSSAHFSTSSELYDWNDIFSEENKRRTIDLLTNDRDSSSFTSSSAARAAAVLVPFCYDVKGRPGLLCNLRSENLSSHKGEISFPGGTFEPQDNNDPVITALRETEEELGITRDEVDVWTTCRAFPTVSLKMGVVPVVGFIKSGPVNAEALQINPSEVDHAFVIPLEHLCNPDNWSNMSPPKRLGGASFTLPTYQNMHEISERLMGIQLWGLTAFIAHLVLTAFIPKQYTRNVDYITLMTRYKKVVKNRENNAGEIANNSPNSKI